MSDDTDLRPGSPNDFGVTVPELPIEEIEPARLLANAARDRLQKLGFDDEHIDEWADAFFLGHKEGSSDELLAWIAEQQSAAR